MALPSTGPITFDDIRTELGITGAITLNDPAVRSLAGIPSGPISLSDLLGKSALIYSGTITVGYKTEVNDKIYVPEYRGFWKYTKDVLGVYGGSITPLTVLGTEIFAVAERCYTFIGTEYSQFHFIVAGHTIPLDFFSTIRIKNGSTVVKTFSRADAAASRGTVMQNYNQSFNATIYIWELPTAAVGQVFPTSGTRTIEIA